MEAIAQSLRLKARNVAMGASDGNCGHGSDGFAVLETKFVSTAPSLLQ